MVVKGLPVALETTLNALSSDHDLSSWQIRGGLEFTQVTLRFSTGLKGTPQMDIQQYRRMSESQITRNRDRAATWRDNQGVLSSGNNGTKYLDTLTVPNITKNQTTLGNQQVPTEQYSMGTESQTATISIANPQVVATCEDIETINSLTKDSTPQVQVVEDNKVNGDINNSDTNSIASSGSISDRHSELIDTSTEEVATCGTCNTPIKAKYGDEFFKCSDCEDMFICRDCHFNHQHEKHRMQIHTYHWVPDPEDIPCDGCGIPFVTGVLKGKQCTVWQCRECQDYALCSSCIEYGGLHIKHEDSFEEKTLEQFKDSL